MAVADKTAYDAVLADLKAQRTKIDAAIAALESLRPRAINPRQEREGNGVEQQVDTSLTLPKLNGDQNAEYRGQSIADASISYLRRVGKPMHVSDIVKAIMSGGVVISGDQANTVGSILNRRAREKGDVKRVGRGMWALESLSLALDSDIRSPGWDL